MRVRRCLYIVWHFRGLRFGGLGFKLRMNISARRKWVFPSMALSLDASESARCVDSKLDGTKHGVPG